MKLKAKFFILMSGLLIIFAFASWFYSGMLLQKINEEWGERFIKKQIVFDKNRTLLPIMREIALAKEMANDPAVLRMALNEDNPQFQIEGIAALERYRLKFQDRSYFAAFTATRHYYFNDRLNRYEDKQLSYTLSPSNKDDQWFFTAIQQADSYQVNVNKDTVIGTTKVWINVLLKYDNKTIGIVGTGLDLDPFLKESVAIDQEGIHNLFVDKNLAIQLERDSQLIDYSSNTKQEGQHQTLQLLIKDRKDLERIKVSMEELQASSDENGVQTLWIDVAGNKQLLGIAYLKEIGWFSLTVVDSKELTLLDSLPILPMLTIAVLTLFFIVGLMLNGLFLTPLNQLKAIMGRTQKDGYTIDPPIVGTGEIAELSEQFNQMVQLVRENNVVLEEKVRERTAALIQSEQKLNTILESVEAYIYIKDTQYRYVYVNKPVRDLFGKSSMEIIGKDDSLFFDEETVEKIRIIDEKVIEQAERVVEEEINTDINGKITKAFLSTKIPLFSENGTVYALCGISTDITERKKTEDIIKQLAFYDSLTQLPNRRLLNERLSLVMAQSKRNGSFGGLMFLDLDNFKTLNDERGHDAGDQLLVEVARRLLSCVREIDTVSRFGGDEFIVVLGNVDTDPVSAQQKIVFIAQKILVTLGQPYILTLGSFESIEHHCGVSIGISLFGKDDINQDTILQQADKAMYVAKQEGRNQIRFYE